MKTATLTPPQHPGCTPPRLSLPLAALLIRPAPTPGRASIDELASGLIVASNAGRDGLCHRLGTAGKETWAVDSVEDEVGR